MKSCENCEHFFVCEASGLCDYWDGWIPANEELPNDNEQVLICYKFWEEKITYRVGFYSEIAKGFQTDGNSFVDLSRCVAWRYMLERREIG